MKLKFHALRAQNFLQIGNEPEVFQLDAEPFTVIVGKNGSGKSTILDAITYVLYKRAYRPKLKLGQLINNNNKKKMLVELAFTAGADTYVVRRGEKPKVFEIYKNKELIEPDPSVGDIQDHLETNILQQNFKTFSQINVISKVSYVQFMDLTPADRRTVVENILDTNIYSHMAKLAKEDLKTLVAGQDQLTTEMTIISNRINDTKLILNSYEKDRQGDIDKTLKQINESKEKLNNIDTGITEIEGELSTAKKKAEEIIPSIHMDKVEQEVSRLTKEIAEHEATIRRTTNIIDKIDSMVECIHCLQVVDDEHKKSIVKQNKDELATAKELMGPLEVRKDGIQKRIDSLRKQESLIRDINLKLVTTRNSLDHQLNTIGILNDRLDSLNQPVKLENVGVVSKMEDELLDVSDRRDVINTKITDTREAIKLLGDDGIKAQVINKYIPIINDKINEYLERMNMFVEFNLDSEFNETVSAINRDLFTYHSFSEGQKMRIDLAILLTWRYISQIRNSMSTNLFILDEVADGSLDDEGMIEFMEILRDLADAQNTFVISHKETTIDNSVFESVIRVETSGNYSKYTRN